MSEENQKQKELRENLKDLDDLLNKPLFLDQALSQTPPEPIRTRKYHIEMDLDESEQEFLKDFLATHSTIKQKTKITTETKEVKVPYKPFRIPIFKEKSSTLECTDFHYQFNNKDTIDEFLKAIPPKSKEFDKSMQIVDRQEFTAVRQTKNKGNGLFSVMHFPVDTIIGFFGGYIEELDINDVENATEKEFGYYLLLFNKFYMNFKKFKGYLGVVNHSCDPNCELLIIYGKDQFKAVTLRVIKEIPSGEEMTIDYNLDTGLNLCHCNTKSCHITIQKSLVLKLTELKGKIKFYERWIIKSPEISIDSKVPLTRDNRIDMTKVIDASKDLIWLSCIDIYQTLLDCPHVKNANEEHCEDCEIALKNVMIQMGKQQIEVL